MIRYLFKTFFIAVLISSSLSAQNKIEISDMRWGADFNIHLSFSNDSTSILDVKALYHSTGNEGVDNSVTYYPVALDPTFVESLKNRSLESFANKDNNKDTVKAKNTTLWSALHPKLGGGYIHFINCLIYSFESRNISIKAPLMTRPKSKWKPKPVTDTYLRTKKWDYYVPDNQKLAIKEFKLQKKYKQLGDITLLPDSFIELFLNTSDKEYEELIKKNNIHEIAIIDMIKLLLGSRYLAKEQIDYIQNAVIKSVMHYNINHLPSVIIFDTYDAAVAMTLDNEGYHIEKVVFNRQDQLTQDEIDDRLSKMEAVISEINEINKKVFEKNLNDYYNK
jgi:hypothetical protein